MEPARSPIAAIAPGRSPAGARRWAWLAALFLLALAIALPGNGARRPLNAHEVFVARTAVEMERNDDFIVPSFDGQTRLQKPPLSYWMTLFAERAFGEEGVSGRNEFCARLPSIVLGAATAATIALLGWVLFDSLWIGAIAALLFVTSAAFVEWSRSAQPEMAYTFACTTMVLGTALAWKRAAAGRGTWGASLLAWTAFALALLAKGPILPAMLLLGAGFALRRSAGGRGIVRTLHLPLGLAWALALAAPYFVMVALRVPGSLEFWRSQMFDRTGGVGSAWWRPLEFYYVGQLLGNWMPWTLGFAPLAWWWLRARRAEAARMLDLRAARRFADARKLAWIAGVPLALLSFSAGRKGYYLLPTFPLWSLLLAWGAVETAAAAAGNVFARILRTQALIVAGLCVGFAIAIALRAEVLELDEPALLATGVACASGALLSAIVWRRAPTHAAGAAILLFVAASAGAAAIGGSGVQCPSRLFTTGEFARAVAGRTAWDRQLIAADGDQQMLLFYTDRRVTRLEPEALPDRLAQEPPPWIVARESEVRKHHIPGRVVLREREEEGEDPLLLVDPSIGAEDRPAPIATAR